MTVLLVPADRGACYWYRLRVPADELTREGVGITWADEFKINCTVEQLMSFDSVVIQRPLNPSILELFNQVKLYRRGDRPLMIAELDDDFWSIPPSSPAAMGKESLLRLTRIIYLADRMVVSTPSLCQKVLAIRPLADVRVAPNCLPNDISWWGDPTKEQEAVVFSGGCTHKDDIEDALVGVRRLMRKLPLYLVGTPYSTRYRHTVHQDWVPDISSHYSRLSEHAGSVGMAPLTKDPFNLSKSNIRLLEYIAAGLLPVATAYGPYDNPRLTYSQVHQGHEWRSHLRNALALRGEERAMVMSRLQSYVKEHYLIAAQAESWKQAWLA